ncbi:acetoacetate--CoA ligase [Paractinoplanes durhamensis]|uniref:Acetoacetyl-CoA synthetase n=1 Tax=Paractinoplanes durhamensis TaxID=113563 RepID=A0ABQ3YRD6_9ACTN|nr:acetoacetate--CoA ligase [Actinoplanes durhamensis]GIE00153.1 acetoacetyl-CoA synthetase [Actinoplanes durhamensis]
MITSFAQLAEARTGKSMPGYRELHEWSVDDLAGFWATVWEFFKIRSDAGYERVLDDQPMPGARWFPGARLNYAEHALRDRDGIALLAVTEDGHVTPMTWDELRSQVAAFAGWLRRQGVGEGDRVVGYLPNAAPAVVAFLATASLGAIWSACGQDYGAEGAAAKFAQLEPVVLVTADGYHFNGRVHDRRAEVAGLRDLLPTLRAVVLADHIGTTGDPGTVPWAEAIATPAPLSFTRVEFSTPLWVLFSSGTTGVPKGIVHGHGGVLLEHLKLLGLHTDLRAGDRFLWYTTTNWMMWNLAVSGLLVGATVVLYDGSPMVPDATRLWRLAAGLGVAVLGTSPGHLLACAKAGVEPAALGLDALRLIGSTGAPLPAACYAWSAAHVGPDVRLVSTTGGTDVVSGFAGSAPTTPIWPGEISAPLLGVALAAWDEDGKPVVGEVGELVVTRPMPSMPVGLWNDPDGSRYRAAYFDRYPGVWRHGDWMTMTERGSVVVSGRSDSTLNRNGVRLGSADLYAVVERLPEVAEALVIGAELSGGGYWMPLFVVLAEGAVLDEALKDRINTAIRTQASPRHVPDTIIAVPAIPHTRTGKKLEVPIKRLLQGATIEQALARDAVDNPALLDFYKDLSWEIDSGWTAVS